MLQILIDWRSCPVGLLLLIKQSNKLYFIEPPVLFVKECWLHFIHFSFSQFHLVREDHPIPPRRLFLIIADHHHTIERKGTRLITAIIGFTPKFLSHPCTTTTKSHTYQCICKPFHFSEWILLTHSTVQSTQAEWTELVHNIQNKTKLNWNGTGITYFG